MAGTEQAVALTNRRLSNRERGAMPALGLQARSRVAGTRRISFAREVAASGVVRQAQWLDGLHARLDYLGDPPRLCGAIRVKILAVESRSQFVVRADRQDNDVPVFWRLSWDGNDSKAGQQRCRAAIQTADFQLLRDVLRLGRPGV